jgi:hypothetical protein
MNNKSIIENEVNSHHARYVDNLWQEPETKAPLYEVKRINSRKAGVIVWRFIISKNVQFEIDETMLEQKDKTYLESVDGVLAVLAEFKKNKSLDEMLTFIKSK